MIGVSTSLDERWLHTSFFSSFIFLIVNRRIRVFYRICFFDKKLYVAEWHDFESPCNIMYNLFKILINISSDSKQMGECNSICDGHNLYSRILVFSWELVIKKCKRRLFQSHQDHKPTWLVSRHLRCRFMTTVAKHLFHFLHTLFNHLRHSPWKSPVSVRLVVSHCFFLD